jgi:hypothetical protein
MKQKLTSSRHVSAAEAIAAALFARSGCDVSVQYGANQPEYDFMVAKGKSCSRCRSRVAKTVIGAFDKANQRREVLTTTTLLTDGSNATSLAQ